MRLGAHDGPMSDAAPTSEKSPPAPYGINAAKGRWINERTFALERRILGRGETQTWSLTFEGDKVTVNFENTDGFKAELHGEMSE